MRVGLLTYHFSDNYGALMQAFGLREWLRRRGVEAVFINYHPTHVESGGKIALGRGLKANIKTLYLAASHARRRFLGDKRLWQAFEDFRGKELGVQGRRMLTRSELGELPKFDLLVCGSDQIWNPSDHYGLDEVYFLDFPGAERARRISYAASFGRAHLATEYGARAAELIRNLDAISVRERSGADIVARLVGRDAECVPDPTILLGDFSELLERNPVAEKGHVLCYALRTAEGVRQAAQLVALENGGEILSPENPHRRWREVGKTVYPSPGEWLSLIANASAIVTNSFHGVALSLVLKRPFVAIALPGARAAFSERVRNLLTDVGLEDRLVPAEQPQEALSKLQEAIDWHDVDGRLAQLRTAGERFLEAQLARVAE
jgi:Uncharacterized conserved protein